MAKVLLAEHEKSRLNEELITVAVGIPLVWLHRRPDLPSSEFRSPSLADKPEVRDQEFSSRGFSGRSLASYVYLFYFPFLVLFHSAPYFIVLC